VVAHLLAARRAGAEDQPALGFQVGPFLVVLFMDQENFLLGADHVFHPTCPLVELGQIFNDTSLIAAMTAAGCFFI
jgi:hypothetical protein